MLRVGFERGLYSRADVRAWVDAEIAARDVLPPQLLDLATMAHEPDQEVVALLKGLEGEVASEVEVRLNLGALRELYLLGRSSLAATISSLYTLAAWSEALSEEERSAIYSLDAAFDLVEYGANGTIDEVRVELKEFLAPYTLPEINGPSASAGEPA